MKTQISIIGCGWLGLPLATALINKGYVIKGSTTSVDKLKILEKHHILPYVISVSQTVVVGDIDGFLSGSSIVIINIPPGLRKKPDKNHISEIEILITHIEAQNIKQVIYISSTSVYKDTEEFPVITETDAPNATSAIGKQLITIEKKLVENTNFNTVILRFSGLFDDNRHPAKYLSGKKGLKHGDAPVNLIHKEDCISIILKLIEKKIHHNTLNASNPEHPTKKAYYFKYCKTHHLELPAYANDQKSKGKIIDSKKLVQLLDYRFRKPL